MGCIIIWDEIPEGQYLPKVCTAYSRNFLIIVSITFQNRRKKIEAANNHDRTMEKKKTKKSCIRKEKRNCCKKSHQKKQFHFKKGTNITLALYKRVSIAVDFCTKQRTENREQICNSKLILLLKKIVKALCQFLL